MPTKPSKATVRKGGIATAIALILAGVYANEGGFVDHKDDPGGATNYGVTEKVARSAGWTGDMRDFPKHCPGIAPEEVCADKIYIERYIEKPGFLPLVKIEPAVAAELVDSAVNFGPARPSRWFQQSLNEMAGARLAVDGKVGPRTIAAYERLQDQRGARGACIDTLDSLDAKQAAEYRRLVRVNPRLKVFFKGWMNHRVGNVPRTQCAAAA